MAFQAELSKQRCARPFWALWPTERARIILLAGPMSPSASSQLRGRMFSIFAFAVTLFLWRCAARQSGSLWLLPALALAVPALILPVIWIGRSSLARNGTAAHATWVTRLVHFFVMSLMGVALISAVLAADMLPWKISFPTRLADFLTTISATAVLFTVLNLAVRGFGAPWAIAISKRLATDWLYARTRNPMMLCLIIFLGCLGLGLHSALFLGWVAAVFVPAMVLFLHFYEERELEVRFGESYLRYRAVTPMFLPRLH